MKFLSRLADLCRRERRSIVGRTLAGLVAVAFLLVAVASAGFYVRDKALNEDAVTAQLADHANERAETLAGWFEGRTLLVRLANDLMAQGDSRAIREGMIRNETVNRSFEEVYFGEQETGGLARSRIIRSLPPGYDARQRPWYVAAVERRDTVVTNPYLSVGDRGIVTTIAVPLYKDGHLLGVTGSDFRLAALMRLLASHEHPSEGRAFVVGANGTILIHPDPALVGRTLSQAVDGRLDPAIGTVQKARVDGRETLFAFRPVAGLPSIEPWYVATTIDADVAAAALRADVVRSGIVTALIVAAMLAGFLLILWIGVLRPLNALTRAIGEVAAGRFDAEVPGTERNDEIGAVARAVAIFRDNGREVARLREQEQAHLSVEAEKRAAMMAGLQAAFGQVVAAASRGDLDQRVSADFADRELGALAASVNLLISTIQRGLDEAGGVLSAIARTDLTQRVEGRYSGAFDAIRQDTNAVADRLSEIVGQLQCTSEQLRGGIGELTSGAQRLRLRADEQAAAVRGTSEEIQLIRTIVARHSADAEIASVEARQARDVGERGARAMRDATAAMERITDTSERVLGIARLLDDIARRTSLVALNAAIEAERAGVSGLTFGVVADEVRRLAMQATDASSEVKALIAAAAGEVADGATMVGHVEVELMAMLGALSHNSALLDRIAVSSRDEVRSIESIETSVGQFAAAARDNLALVMDLGRFAVDADCRATELDAIVDRFTLVQQPAVRVA